MEEGFNIDPILHNAGIKVGSTFYDNLKDAETEVMVNKIADFWQENKLGCIKIEKLEPLTLMAYDCFECEDLPVHLIQGYLKHCFQPPSPRKLM